MKGANMKDEQAETLEALRFAIQMEIEGKEYYQKASQKTYNLGGKELFQWLAEAEDKHRQRFEEIYEAIKNKKAWPEIDPQPGKKEKLSTLFAKAMETTAPNIKAPSAELDVVAKAMEMENETLDFYKNRVEKAVFDAEKNFYEALADEEKGHYLALVDYREYLIDPEGWFRKAEHHSLDGG
jgi:rubrerythrin